MAFLAFLNSLTLPKVRKNFKHDDIAKFNEQKCNLEGNQWHSSVGMISNAQKEKQVSLRQQRNISVCRATGSTLSEAMNFFRRSCIEEETVSNRSLSEIEQWIDDGGVYIAQCDKRCIGFARITPLSRALGSVDALIKDFNFGYIKPIHEGSCKHTMAPEYSKTPNVYKSIEVDLSATLYVSAFTIESSFRKSRALPLLAGVIQRSIFSYLQNHCKSIETQGASHCTCIGMLFGTSLTDCGIWRLMSKKFHSEVSKMFGNDIDTHYISFLTSRPDGLQARGNFVYFFPPNKFTS